MGSGSGKIVRKIDQENCREKPPEICKQKQQETCPEKCPKLPRMRPPFFGTMPRATNWLAWSVFERSGYRFA
jgi:hypothetical protein